MTPVQVTYRSSSVSVYLKMCLRVIDRERVKERIRGEKERESKSE